MSIFDVADPKFLDAMPLKGVGSEHLRDGLILPAHLSSSVYATDTPVAIDPDDAGIVGTSPLLSRGDHGHEWLTAAPSSLAKTASNTEGTSGDGARADHGHATDAFPWGHVAREKLIAPSSGFTASGATDLNVSPSVNVLRLYEVCVLTTWTVTVATGRWIFTLTEGGTIVSRLGDTTSVVANHSDVLYASTIWEPATGTPSLELRVTEVGDGSTLTLNASATEPRYIWVKDIGLR